MYEEGRTRSNAANFSNIPNTLTGVGTRVRWIRLVRSRTMWFAVYFDLSNRQVFRIVESHVRQKG